MIDRKALKSDVLRGCKDGVSCGQEDGESEQWKEH